MKKKNFVFMCSITFLFVYWSTKDHISKKEQRSRFRKEEVEKKEEKEWKDFLSQTVNSWALTIRWSVFDHLKMHFQIFDFWSFIFVDKSQSLDWPNCERDNRLNQKKLIIVKRLSWYIALLRNREEKNKFLRSNWFIFFGIFWKNIKMKGI